MLRDKDCKTALEVAEQFNKYETAQLLRDHAAAPAAAQPSCSRRRARRSSRRAARFRPGRR